MYELHENEIRITGDNWTSLLTDASALGVKYALALKDQAQRQGFDWMTAMGMVKS